MTTDKTPTDAEIAALYADETGFALRASHGQAPAGAGEAAEHYRNAIARACEGWTMPDGLRKHLEDALWNPPTPQPTQTQPVAREPLPKFLALKFHARRDKKATVTLLFPGHEAADAWVRGTKGGQHGEATPQPTQPVEREPLTPERVKEIVRGAGYDQCGIPDTERAAFINGLRHGEREHGIKGGQHVS